MTSPQDGPGQRAAEEAAAREAALADALAGQYAPPPPGHGRIAYHIAHSFAQSLRPQVEADVQQQRFAPPADPYEQHVYRELYRHIEQLGLAPPAATGTTDRLVPPTATPRATRRCPDCHGPLGPIRLIDRAQNPYHSDIGYALPDSQPSMWRGVIPIAGTVEALLCADCGRILLYGRPSDGLS